MSTITNCNMGWVNVAGASLRGVTFSATDLTGAHIEGTDFANASGFSPGLPHNQNGYPLELQATTGVPMDLYTPCVKPLCGGLCQKKRPIWLDPPQGSVFC